MAKLKVSNPAESGPRISRRLRDVNSFHVMSLMAEAKKLDAQGHQVIHMEMGGARFFHATADN